MNVRESQGDKGGLIDVIKYQGDIQGHVVNDGRVCFTSERRGVGCEYEYEYQDEGEGRTHVAAARVVGRSSG